MQRCNCAHQAKREFDAKEAFDNLSHKYRELARLMSQYMSEAKLDRSARVNNASAMADELDRIVGGQPTTAFPECCLVGHRIGSHRFEWFCTGVSVHPRVVLTAGHCNVPPAGEQVPSINVVALRAATQDDLSNANTCSARSMRS